MSIKTIPMRPTRILRTARIVCTVLSSIFATSCARPLPAPNYVPDFDRFCTDVGDHYAYFDQKPIDWSRACADNRPLAKSAATRDAFISVLEKTLGELHDFHAHLATSNSASPRLVPTDSDLRARWENGRAIITDVRRGSSAERAGARLGMDVVAIDNQAVEIAIAARQPQHLRANASPLEINRAQEWALNQLLAGKQNQGAVHLTCGYEKSVHEIVFVPYLERPTKPLSAAEVKDFGYIRIHNSLGDEALIADFDWTLNNLRHNKGLIIDLRDTPSGGTSTVARGLMSRFVDSMRPYQMHEDPEEQRRTKIRRVWIEQVLPRETKWKAPVVVLVGAWTGSMGEGIAIGLHATIQAPIVGQRMAGLLGALGEFSLPTSGITVRIPTEQLFDVSGKPREAFEPCKAEGIKGTNDQELTYAVEILEGKRQPCEAMKVAAP